MKTKIKTLSILASALCAVVGSATLLSACGEEPVDYSTYTYTEWSAMTDSDWDKKTISYQLETGVITNEITGNSQIRMLINLYEDGTLLIYEAGLYNTDPGMSDAAWYDQDRHIAWAFYGFWEKSAGFMGQGTCLKLYYLCLKSPEGTTAKVDDSWAKNNDYCYRIEISETVTDSGVYALTYNENEPMVYLGANLKAEPWPVDVPSIPVWAGADIQYSTIQSWVDVYIGNSFITV